MDHSSDLPNDALRIRLAKVGVPADDQTRERLWALLAKRWRTGATVPEMMSTDHLARTVIAELLADQRGNR